jgi:hypothetical protein
LATQTTDLRRSRPARLAEPLGLAAVAGLGALALRFRDPHESGSWGYCPFNLITGGYCPGCGGLRAVNDLTRLDVAGAASSNLLFVAALPLIATFWLLWVRAAASGRDRPKVPWSPALVGGIIATAVLFTVLRNTGAGAWLAP